MCPLGLELGDLSTIRNELIGAMTMTDENTTIFVAPPAHQFSHSRWNDIFRVAQI
jgi:hypothetical protein